MNTWTHEQAHAAVLDFQKLLCEEQGQLLTYLNQHFPVDSYKHQCILRRTAIENMKIAKTILKGTQQIYPQCVSTQSLPQLDPQILKEYAIILTAGGEGERLRLTLLKQGVDPHTLQNFSKATYPLPGFFGNLGTLAINCCLISHLCKQMRFNIPVIITVGPENSVTARVIAKLLDDHQYFGLKHCFILNQPERLHLTDDEQIVYTARDGMIQPVTNPDETGGPLVQLKSYIPSIQQTGTTWIASKGCKKIILLQGTAVYNPTLLHSMAMAGLSYDGVGIGINRQTFPTHDPYGTFVLVDKHGDKKLCIIEQDIRNETTRILKDPTDTWFLPYNTGFYVFDLEILNKNDLPDYATPPKEIIPGIHSPKIGYAATDIVTLAKKPAVFTISESDFGVIKQVQDLQTVSQKAINYGLDLICKDIVDMT